MMTTTMNEDVTLGKDKPILLRAVFILNMVKIAITTAMLIAVQFFDASIAGIAATALLYTLIGYVATFAAMIASILKRNIMAYRAVMIADIIISLPLKAFIGIAIGIFGLTLTFLSKTMRAYFSYRA